MTNYFAYYGNYNSHEVFQVPLTDTGFAGGFNVIKTGNGPYPVDNIGFDRILAITRKQSGVTSIFPKDSNRTENIVLNHLPRSSSFNKNNGLTLIAGKNKVQTTIIDSSNKIISVVGSNDTASGEDYGGSLACGHPRWFDDNHFFMLNRSNRSIELWDLNGNKLSSVNTPTSVHHLITDNSGYLFALCEGNQKSITPPSLMKFEVKENHIKVLANLFMPSLGVSVASMGAHHIDLHPSGNFIYLGSTEGRIFVINLQSMSVDRTLTTGKGTGHTGFIRNTDLAIVINHIDTFITLVDTTNNTVIKNITVAEKPSVDGKAKTIGHTFSANPNSTKFYGSAPQDGKLFEIDLSSLKVSDKLELTKNSNPLQGTFVWENGAEDHSH